MKRKEIFLVVILVAFGVIYQAVEKGRVRFSRDFSFYANDRRPKGTRFSEFPGQDLQFPDVSQVRVENPAGEVTVENSSDGLVHLAAKVRVYHSGKEDSAAAARNAEVRTDLDAGILKVSVRAPSPFPYRSLRVLLHLRVPAGIPLSVRNQEGDVMVRGTGKDLRIDQENGDLILENIPSRSRLQLKNGVARMRGLPEGTEIIAAHARVDIEEAASLNLDGRHVEFSVRNVSGDAVVEMAYGKLIADGVGRLEIRARHGNITARNIRGGASVTNKYETTRMEDVSGDIRIFSRSGKIDLRRASGNVVIENSYANIAIAGFSGASLDVLLKNGNLELSAADVSDRVNIKARYAELDLSFAALIDPTFSIKTVHGRISAAPRLGLDSFQDKEEAYANRDGQKPEILIHNTYGNVRVNAAD
jgi:hypothetical protein